MHAGAYAAGVALLARREMSTEDVRRRLARLGHAEADIAAAIERLTATRLLDDRRFARAFVHARVERKLQGRARVERELAEHGITGPIAEEALAETFGEGAERELIERALARRVRGAIRDPREFRRHYQFLLRRGFSRAASARALKARYRGDPDFQ